ncbi:MAG TPA: C1 family peptidase [Polyangiaceae bacterium]|jgi:hypothetical protein|nr:C1 family peptidase [Polyangiaceae bacterium]
MSITIDVDLRERLGEVRDQGPRPTCLVFAVSAAHEAKRKSTAYLSPEFLFFSGVQRSHKDPKRGLARTVVQEALVEDGQPLESAWPYLVETPAKGKWQSPKLAADAIHKATIDFAPRTVAQICEVLRAGTPVLLVIALTVAMYKPNADGVVRGSAIDSVTTRRHAVVAIGSGQAEDGTYLLIRNSWGKYWGASGHAWLHEPYLTPHLQTTGIIG